MSGFYLPDILLILKCKPRGVDRPAVVNAPGLVYIKTTGSSMLPAVRTKNNLYTMKTTS